MHEFSICQSLVNAVVAEMKKLGANPPRLLKARIVVGYLRQIVPEFIRQAYLILTKNTVAEGSTLEIRHTPIKGACGTCDWNGEMAKDELFCPACGGNKVKITSGAELYLENLEVEDDNP